MQEDRELREIRRLIAVRDNAEHSIADSIREARSHGATWEEIGAAMGIATRQGAYQWLRRYDRLKGSK